MTIVEEQNGKEGLEQNKMEIQPLIPLIISMSLPPMASMFMQYTYNFVDCMFVSWISEGALTAVSLAFPITTLILSISIGLGVGTNTLIAKYLGSKNQDSANNIVSHSLILSSILGIILTILTLLIVKPFFSAFTDDPIIYQLGLDYTYIVAFMVFGNMVHISIQKIIQATGNMIAPMLFQIAGVILNFILDPILIFGWFGFPAMGVKGAAIATVLGYSFSMILAFYVLIFRKQKVKIKIKGFQLEWKIFKQIIIIGFPSLIMFASFFQATGRIYYSIIINLLRQLLLLIPSMWILSNIMGISGIWWAFIVAELVTTIVCIVLFIQKEVKGPGLRFEG